MMCRRRCAITLIRDRYAVRPFLISLYVLAAFAATPSRTEAQIHAEVNGNVGYTLVDLVEWVGQGVFNGDRLLYGGDVALVFGRRYGRGLQLALDLGFQHLVDFQFVEEGVPQPYTGEAYRSGLTTRFWFQEGLWFGEVGMGAFRFSDRTDPSILGGFGTLVQVGEHLAIPIRARGSVVFGTRDQIGPIWFSTGLSYRLRR